MAGPIAQFEIKPIVRLFELGGIDVAFTNSAAWMVATVLVAFSFLMLGIRGRALVPGRWQSAVELTYEFVARTVRDCAGEDGMRFFPLVFSLFMFVLVANLLGMLPFSFSVTSHLAVTGGLAAVVFLTVTIYGFWKNGFRFLRLFLPSGIPVVLAPVIVLIELVSYISRPVSHSVRLFAVMLAGHITLKIFAGFAASLAGFGAIGWVAALAPFGMTLVITALELLMACIQAYVFTMLTCMYLNDALHPSH